jgi:hypothetical protein
MFSPAGRVVARRKQVDVDGRRVRTAPVPFARKQRPASCPLMIDHGSLLILESRLLKHGRADTYERATRSGGRIFAGNIAFTKR